MNGGQIDKVPAEEGASLPPSLTISKFSAARGKEVEIMKKALASSSSTKLAFQRLPKHMRRRAMSHNVKRLPRRLREIHTNQMKKSGIPPKQKRSSRKYRRRPYNLMSDYMRRQRKHTWLNTHIWHAKRFHMIEKWGFKLPERPCDRAFRACYRATVKHCLLQDISYYSCVEINGDYDIIIKNLVNISDPATGLTIASKCYSKGCREGCTTLFQSRENKKAIGSIYFHWKPITNGNKHTLWIWIHAAYYCEIFNILVNTFNLKLVSMETDLNRPVSYLNHNSDVEVKELKSELNRFRLTGPLSTSILQKCFRLPEENVESALDWIKNSEYSIQLRAQKEVWKDLENVASPGEISPHMILSLIILDPRFYMPKKRTKAVPDITRTSSYMYAVPKNSADGPIWDSNIRNIVKKSKVPNSKINELRRNLLVPGSDLTKGAVPIPILLVQRPGKKTRENSGYGNGWDIILPSEWANVIWLALIMWGARPGGLRESNSISFYMDREILYPDTQAGAEEEKVIADKCKEVFFKLPPNKRTNYNKYGITSPMTWNWKLLLSEWNDSVPVEEFHVLRDRKLLRTIQEMLTSKANHELPNCLNNYLVPVCIKLTDKGLCTKFAVICLPEEGDLRNCPIELDCVDKNEILRKEMRKNHKILLNKLRKRRKRGKKKGKVIPIDMDMLKNYTNTMRKLWLPDTTIIRHSCSRQVMGFVKYGDFCLLLGQSKAIGYIPLKALSLLLSQKTRNKVLVRNTTSRQYRVGTLEIVID